MRVHELMSPSPWTCAPNDSLDVAASLLWEHDVGVLPVVDGGVVVGMLTDRDVCMAAYTRGRPLRELQVRGAMSGVVHVARRDESLSAAMSTMAEEQVRRLPVVDAEGRLVGLLSVNDLTTAAMVGDLRAERLVDTLAAISRSRSPGRQPVALVPMLGAPGRG